jgi:ABC-type lipoprotein export system ATPase subunit
LDWRFEFFSFADMAKTLELQNVCFDTLPPGAIEFSEIWLQTLCFQKGEQVLVSAPSGKGKSTFIGLLYGLRKDYTGDYFVDGAKAKSFSLSRWSNLRSREMSIVFQDLRLFADYTGWENLAIKGKLEGSRFEKNEVFAMAEILGIEGILEKKAHTFSYGEKQRLAIVRSLLQPADFMVMDEPFSHLDQNNCRLALEMIQKEAMKNNAGLIITSLGADYGRLYDRILLL